MIKVLCLGSNPSEASPDVSAFHPNTRSRVILDRWFKDLDVDIHYGNIRDQSTPKNRSLRVSEIKESALSLPSKVEGYDRVVTLGKSAALAAEIAGIKHYAAPHPSGLNRLLNNKAFVSRTIAEIKEYVCT
jgi:hypothetical protein